jgi:S-adenosylmethionine decarboxylase
MTPRSGAEWIVDAHGCPAERLRSRDALEWLFARIVRELALLPIAPARWHAFPPPGGISGIVLLSESHLTCHTFPEHGFAAFNLYCCRPRPAWDWSAALKATLGASEVRVHTLSRGSVARARPVQV